MSTFGGKADIALTSRRVRRRCNCRDLDPRSDRDLSKSFAVVCWPRQALFQSAELGIRPGLDHTLCSDGLRAMAHFAYVRAFRHTSLSDCSVSHFARIQRRVVVDVFLGA